ncbi:MAG: alpha-2-macroglobulin family protein, partial [Acidobacteriota bacterium]
EQPLPAGADEGAFRTPGDAERPRWNPQYTPAAVLRSWKDGREQGAGTVAHDEKGEAMVALPRLPAGAYRLRYTTRDEFGATFEEALDLIVAAARAPVALPALLLAEQTSVGVGGTARILACSGIPGQPLFLDRFRDGELIERRLLSAGKDAVLIEVPIGPEDRGGFALRLWALADHQLMQQEQAIFVPWDDRKLEVELSTFRDRLTPGGKETWRVTVKDAAGKAVEARAAELLAYMYDRSLDIFAPHQPPDPLGLYPNRTALGWMRVSLGQAQQAWAERTLPTPPTYPALIGDRLKFYDGYGSGGPGRRRFARTEMAMAAPMAAMKSQPMAEADGVAAGVVDEARVGGMAQATAAPKEQPAAVAPPEQPTALRSDFAETAFWRPQLVTGAGGSAAIEFTVPDSVTAWNVWVHAVTKDLRAGSLRRDTRSVKELMVRPYLPRFLREGDRAEIKVVVNNAGEERFAGKARFEILDPETNAPLNAEFGLPAEADAGAPFVVEPGGGTNLSFTVTAPRRVGLVAFKVTASAGGLSDGELRPLPLLPGRVHLAQSRFVTLRDRDRRELTFEDLKRNDDPTLVNDSLVVTVDAQLFYTALQALPYLINYPYECTEQTLNRFVSTGILTGLYDLYPAVARMAQEMAKRETRLETWDSTDPNRKMALEETPWLVEAKGGDDRGLGLTNVLDPRIARAEREASLAKLRKAQTAIGGFPWWPGGPPSPYMTLYIMYGFAKAAEFGVEIPRDMVERGWQYLALHFREEYARKLTHEDCCFEFLTFLNYVASCYPDPSWMGDALTKRERTEILDFSFKHWKQHAPYLKGLLALTLKRMGRPADARLVFDSVMDSAKTTPDEGTFWAPEDRAWLWYNDTIETHAFALRTLTELAPRDARRDGLVHWLLLNKKLNHWKSTRATAEVIYSLAHYMKAEGTLGIREDATVTVGGQRTSFIFEPDRYTGKANHIVIPGEKIDPPTMSTVVVEKESKGFAFASATWHFSTDRMPAEARGDLLSVERRYFKREQSGKESVLKPLAEGAVLQPGDEVEVQLSLRAKHPCEYVHLRDPRGAGFEPVSLTSEFKWNLGIGWYEEVRDSGANFFFEWLPQGEYTFKYRLRASMAGVFKAGPATVQSMYAPEFAAYSSGATLTVGR